MPLAESQLKLLLDTAHGGFYTVASDGTTLLCNKGFLSMLGFADESDAVGRKLHDIIHRKHPDGSHYDVQDCPIYKCASQGIAGHVDDEFFYHLDGTPIPVEYWVHPILRDGQPDGAVCTFVDVSERRRAHALQQTLTHELGHRIKNTLAMVQAIVHQSLKNAPTIDAARVAIGDRLQALGSAHDLLTSTSWRNAPMSVLVEKALAPHAGARHRIGFDGPEIQVGARAALSLSMALHELATNATKYGSLSTEAGIVKLSWSVAATDREHEVHMIWREIGGPNVVLPSRQGFGSRLVGRNFASDFGGVSELKFAPDGLVWTFKAPLSGIKQL